MPPPLPPSLKAPRRRYSNDKQQEEISPRLSSRRYREDEVRPPTGSTSRYGTSARRRSSSDQPTTSTTDTEIERIREIRERRKRAERLERGEGLVEQDNIDNERRSSRASIAREDLEKSGLVRKNRRRLSGDSGSSHGETSSSIDTTTTTKSPDVSSTRSEIQARLAARRRQQSGVPRKNNSLSSSGDEHEDSKGPQASELQARLAARRRLTEGNSERFVPLAGESDAKDAAEISSRRSEIQARLAAARRRRSGTLEVPGSGVISGVEEGPTIDRSDLEARLAARRSRRYSGDGPSRGTALGKPASETSRSSDDSESKTTSESSGIDVASTERTWQARERARKSKPQRTNSSIISERLRERREARERDRKEREKHDSTTVSTESSGTSVVTKSTGRDTSAVERKSAASALKSARKAMASAKDDSPKTTATATSRTTTTTENGDWSVRLCVISASDLPFNLVPNMPLCPVLKMGLVDLPRHFKDDLETNPATSAVMDELGDNGVETLSSAMTRSTTPKILSRRDNGTVDFHQEYRWDNVSEPRVMGLCVELLARAVNTPTNYRLSPPALLEQDNLSVELTGSPGGRSAPSSRGVSRTSSLDVSRNRGLSNRITTKEMEAAEAAAAVARMLVDDEGKNGDGSRIGSMRRSEGLSPDCDVSLRNATTSMDADLTKDVRLGSVVIPLTRLSKSNKSKSKETVRLEQWHQLEVGKDADEMMGQRKSPSVFLEISLSTTEVLDESEDELEEEGNSDSFKASSRRNPSFSRRACIESLKQTDDQQNKKEKAKTEDPVLEPGVVDFMAVVGCKNIGNQKNDDGRVGWVKTTPECVVLEQFPPNNEFHFESGRKALLPEMLQWFCYPEGAKLWRGTAPPTHSDLNLKPFSLATPANVASSIAAFDACLGCATSFSWFVIASNSDEYGSSLVKTYGGVIRFYVPAPTGIDSTQDDFAQAIMGGKPNMPSSASPKRLWVPIAICLTSNLPIIGVMEALLLRTCEELATVSEGAVSSNLEEVQKAIGYMLLNYQRPISGAVNCSVPFLTGDRLLLSLPPSTCLPPLPHGRAITSVCRLLGTEGLSYLLAAVLTECKILLHSDDIAEIAMVAEVITALTYPFAWSLPYIPVLPIGMIEFVEAPLSYLLGIPTCNLKMIDPGALDDTVVFDLNKKFSSSDVSQEKLKQKSAGSKHPPPLPTLVATNLSNAIYKLLYEEEQMEEECGESNLLEQSLPRLEVESLAEREFRVTVAIEICGLLRGYEDCMGAVFNRDKFLKSAPALYEERREYKINGGRSNSTKAVSSRSKRFLSSLVSGQNFQQFIESLESEEATFFHEILETIDDSASDRKALKKLQGTDELDFNQADKNVAILMKSLQRNEDKIPTFCVEKSGKLGVAEGEHNETLLSLMFDNCKLDDLDAFYPTSDAMDFDQRTPTDFMKNLLSAIEVESTTAVSDSGMQAVSMEYLAKLETNPWDYNPLLKNIPQDTKTSERLKLREAIGEKRFRAWKLAQDKNSSHDGDLAFLNESTAKQGSALNLTTLVTSAKNDTSDSSVLSSDTLQSRMSSLTPAQQRIAAAKSRDVIRRCLDRATVAETSESEQANPFMENGRDLMAEAEKALRNPSAQLFLVSILAQRSRLDNKRTRTIRQNTALSNSASRLDPIAFDCLIRLSCAMLDSCMEYKDFEMAYRLLTNSAGFIMIQELENLGEPDEFGNEESIIVISMTSRVGLHPIFADIGVWEAVMALHLRDRKADKKSDEFNSYDSESDDEGEEEAEYEAAVATLYEMVGYGIPGEELSRFAMRASQAHGWFCDDRGRQLLMLARRISIRRDQSEIGGTGNTADIDMVRKGPEVSKTNGTISEVSSNEKPTFTLSNVAWCHPAARSASAKSDSESNLNADNFMKRTPVTAIASFGSSIVASGGLDGGVFLAHSITFGSQDGNSSHNSDKHPEVKGIHLDWGSASRARTGSTSDGEYGVGAVSCLAAAYGDAQNDSNPSSTKDTKDSGTKMDFIEAMEGNRIIAGTTAGDLRVWSVKDIYSSISFGKNDQESKNSHNSSRLKYSLRGRALSGHRGGVTCIDVPSQVYRPDSLVTGGADGLIKMWALRAPTGSRRSTASSGGDALSTLSGHSGRILCIKTAWHGDHLLSGGADRTIRVWDLASSGGKCIHKLFGHFGWITDVQYWGPNTIVSASTDRSVALWDARVRSSPLFILRNHQSPISDLLVGSRTDPYMVSAGADGTIATWDFRSLSDATATDNPGMKDSSRNGCKMVRLPSASIRHNAKIHQQAAGSVHLSRDVTDPINSFLSVGSDAILRKWNFTTGEMVDETPTGHCDTITSFDSYAQSHTFSPKAMNPSELGGENSKADLADTGFLTSSLDGTIRIRKFVATRND